MVAEASSTTTKPVLSPAPVNAERVPLLPDNNGRTLQRRPKSKDVTSRYLSYTSSSKLVTDTKSYSNSVCTTKKRVPSPVASPVSNRRDQCVPMAASAKMLTKTSARSLSVSFQGESFALPVRKVRNDTPEMKKRPATQGRSRRWNFMTMSVDFTDEKLKLSRTEIAESKLEHNKPESVCIYDNSDHPVSDTDSSSSGGTHGNVRGGDRRAIVVPARFWQETISLLRRVQPVPVSPPLLKKKNNKPISGSPKLPPRGSSVSPSPESNGGGGNSNLGKTPSILSFCADSKRGKVGEKKVVDAHVLRLLHNKHMQWRFANAKADAAMSVRRAAAQKNLYNAWVTISKLWHSVTSKRLQTQELKHNLKLHSLLKKQMMCLDDWDLTERDHSISLAGVIVALESSSLCLPVLCGAKADTQNFKDAICSAVDVMEAMVVSICSFATKVENVNSMASELANAMKTECSLLDQCKDLLSALTPLEGYLKIELTNDVESIVDLAAIDPSAINDDQPTKAPTIII
ncbi:hypothetical protein E3N88_25659 [Mikania micrantha]|uniref:Uncharacterized protein n=1 Tax=Mikania micrantha TaxID=192012 RepID=A0A5N6N851_9ASTR|nr:hypothetical protein E3N88_25659 [Mikania micrantha]